MSASQLVHFYKTAIIGSAFTFPYFTCRILFTNPKPNQINTMSDIQIHIEDDRQRFYIGDQVRGTVNVVLDEDVPLSAVTISLHCLAEVKWVEYPGTPYYLDGFVYYDKYCYLDTEYDIPDKSSRVLTKGEKSSIPFEFTLPKK